MTVRDLEAAALDLAPEERARLAARLLASLDELSPGQAEALWLSEAERRDLEVESGRVETLPGDEALDRLTARFG